MGLLRKPFFCHGSTLYTANVESPRAARELFHIIFISREMGSGLATNAHSPLTRRMTPKGSSQDIAFVR